ncbi:STAS domain-containing protein [Actinomadura chibensis]|uniref:Anti-sigma factor antagonist n=1 Tax=Actinomadura chibensis TaxID=392828 RepID=A0A5D0NL16_9ACTN|nr:STAS domain-containing protein [Actinomadura chibensis]TYB44948.1 STAS domain-containing protein [Actinomadura chibensis]
MPLTLEHRCDHDLAVVVLAGEIDVATSAGLREDLARLVASGARHLILDLGAVAFIDSSGLSVLLSFHHHLRGRHGSIVLAAVNQRIREVLRVTQLTRVFPIYGTADVAVQAHHATRTGPDTAPAPPRDRDRDRDVN